VFGLDNSAAIRKLVESLGSGGDARAQVITPALLLGSMEARLCGGSRYVHSLAVPVWVGECQGRRVSWQICQQTVAGAPRRVRCVRLAADDRAGRLKDFGVSSDPRRRPVPRVGLCIGCFQW
jgi:hypothetical protein